MRFRSGPRRPLTGNTPDRDGIIELGVCFFEYDRQTGRIYKILGSWGVVLIALSNASSMSCSRQ
jgi:hypothetical protein